MNYNLIFKYIFFWFHMLSICSSFIIVFLYWQILLIQAFVILSWYLNDNKCILTQIEYLLFQETIITFFLKKQTSNFRVSQKKRNLFYLLFFLGCIYHYYKYNKLLIS